MEQTSQLRQLGLFDARVPRYTSYPTAAHFNNNVSHQTVANWIKNIPEGEQISLYIHVPFCRRLCWFCACRTQGTQSAEPLQNYLRVLLREIEVLAAKLPSGVRLSRMHWGGGTPTLLPPEAITTLCDAIAKVLPLSDQAEFSVEVDPNEIDRARLDALVRGGLTRASIGVQDFNPEIQKTIGRIQSFECTRDAVQMIRDQGIASVNADILYGLPHQTPARIAETVQQLLALSPDRVALYGYAHVPWMAKRQVLIPDDSLPDPHARLELFETARKLFVADTYTEIGIDHFARPEDGLAVAQREGRLRRNFQGYTDDRAEVLIGLGASSISRFPEGYAQNQPQTRLYANAIAEGRLATCRGFSLTREDIWRARAIEALMCDFQLDLDELRDRFAVQPEELAPDLRAICSRFTGMVAWQGRRLTILPHGRPLTRMIAQALDRHSTPSTGYSSAI